MGALDSYNLAVASAIASGKGLHVEPRPVDVSTGGAYYSSHRHAIVNTQAANSRLLTLQNPSASMLVIPTSINIKWMQAGNHTAAIEDSLDVYKLTGFTAVDSVNVVTPAVDKMRTAYPAASGVVKGVTVAGAAAGMTGGTLTKATQPFRQLPQWMIATQSTVKFPFAELAYVPRVDVGEAPMVLAQNEGIMIENRVLLGAAASSSVYIDIEWLEVPLY